MTQQWKPTLGDRRFNHLPKQLPGAMAGSEAGQISFWRKEKVLTNAPGCLAAGADTLRAHGGATLPTQACGSTCSFSSSPFPSDPITDIYGALTTVTWWCCRSRACFPLGEPTVPAGECGRRDGMPALHSLWASKRMILINGKPQQPSRQGQLKWTSSTKGPFFGFPGSI